MNQMERDFIPASRRPESELYTQAERNADLVSFRFVWTDSRPYSRCRLVSCASSCLPNEIAYAYKTFLHLRTPAALDIRLERGKAHALVLVVECRVPLRDCELTHDPVVETLVPEEHACRLPAGARVR